MPDLTTLAILQNQWFPTRSIPGVERTYKHYGSTPESRAKLNARYLFFRCLTGKRLRIAFGDDCDRIIWENASRHIGNESCSKAAGDPEHIRGLVAYFKPRYVLLFGAVASEAWRNALPLTDAIAMHGPHPASRASAIQRKLNQFALQWRELSKVEDTNHDADS